MNTLRLNARENYRTGTAIITIGRARIFMAAGLIGGMDMVGGIGSPDGMKWNPGINPGLRYAASGLRLLRLFL